jgi:Uma2 family endonuclease
MPVAFDETIAPTPDQPPRRRWTRAECELMASMGLLDGERLELIDGELLRKMGKNNPHVWTVMLLHKWLQSAFGFDRVSKEDPINVADGDNEHNEPEPDLVVLRQPRSPDKMKPSPDNLLLVIEVADSTRSFDLTKKADLYARAGIQDYWVFDTNRRELIVHREPSDGKYNSVAVSRGDESIAPLAAPQLQLKVSAAFDNA